MYLDATAISLTPMLSSQLLKIQEKKAEGKFSFYQLVNRLLGKLDAAYEKLIRWVLCHKTVVISAMFLLFIGSLSLARFIKSDFMPQNDQDNLNVYAKMQSGQRWKSPKTWH